MEQKNLVVWVCDVGYPNTPTPEELFDAFDASDLDPTNFIFGKNNP